MALASHLSRFTAGREEEIQSHHDGPSDAQYIAES